MGDYKIVEIKEDITSRNNLFAKEIKKELKERKIFYINVMASPGSGKTTLITNLINRLKKDYRIGVIEADIDSDVDADSIAKNTGVKTIQMHTGGACHITCQMSYEALTALGMDNLDVIILENIGNLVCPAEFDTGATCNLVLLSVPEGDDKPLKYPLMFQVANVVAITKIDISHVFDFDVAEAEKNVHMRNPKAPFFVISATENKGIDELEQYLRGEINKVIL